jgi:hypothetical protein
MSVFCIVWQKPGPWLRLLVTIVIYLVAVRFAPGEATPLALGATLGNLLSVQRTSPFPAGEPAEGAA